MPQMARLAIQFAERCAAELRGDQHTLDLRAVSETKEKLSRRILRPRQPYDTWPAEGECSCQPGAQRVR